jgi:RNA polymerase sigma-70 factor (ECF subfamily)
MTDTDPSARFERARPKLWGIAYRMTGSAADADELVQEAYLRLARREPERIEDAYLTKMVVHASLDRLKSARAKRERYVGPWLPEPVLGEEEPSDGRPDDALAQAESLQTAFLLLLERLSPVERAVFLLHEVFGHSFAEVARLVGRSEVTCRKIASRARMHVRQEEARHAAPPAQADALLRSFIGACAEGDLEAMKALLAEDVELVSDGGGEVTAARRPVRGSDAVARFAAGVWKSVDERWRVEHVPVNGAPGALLWRDDELVGAVSAAATGNAIEALYLTLSPTKLTSLRKSRRAER